MSYVEPIRTLHGPDARWALTVQPHDPVPQHDGHWVREKSLSMERQSWWAVITCSCGQTFSGALRP